MRVRTRALAACVASFALAVCASPAAMAASQETPPSNASVEIAAPAATPFATRSGRDIYTTFRAGLADPECPANGGSARWKQHFANAPKRMASSKDDVLPLFGYVVDAVREAHLPTEYALIPFVESGYRPGARSPNGPAGLWQFIALTARNHQVPIRGGYDGRLSPVDSTRAAVRYLKTLHGMFAGDWRLAVMAYNAGEYRVLGALRRAGQNARNARPETLPGLSPITHAYVQKLRALSCLLEQADDREEWLRALDRPVVQLRPQPLPANATTLEAWARTQGLDAAQLRRFNPAFQGGRIGARSDRALHVLAPAPAVDTRTALVLDAPAPAAAGAIAQPLVEDRASRRTHTVVRGDSLSKIGQRYGVATGELIARNKLDKRASIRPGMVLLIDDDAVPPTAAAGP